MYYTQYDGEKAVLYVPGQTCFAVLLPTERNKSGHSAFSTVIGHWTATFTYAHRAESGGTRNSWIPFFAALTQLQAKCPECEKKKN